MCRFALGNCEFYLQDYYVPDWANNFMLFLEIDDADRWWAWLSGLGLPERYPGVRLKPPENYPWGLREVHLIDPSGVLWHIAQDLPRAEG